MLMNKSEVENLLMLTPVFGGGNKIILKIIHQRDE